MPYRKEVVCLANSRKHRGKCFAGKEVLEEGYGGWIRPVSCREDERISYKEQRFADGSYPQLLNVVSIPMLEPKPMHHQQENHLIDEGQHWEKMRCVDHNVLPELLDIPGDLWINGNSSNTGCNDRVLFADAINLENSLLLIAPTSLQFIVQWKEYDDTRKRQVRADFHHNKNHYNLAVTDPVIEKKYKDMARSDDHEDEQGLPREYPATVDGVYLCISLGEKSYGYCYKLVAAVIKGPD